MIRYIPLLPLILSPYALLLVLVGIYNGWFTGTAYDNTIDDVLLGLIALYLFALLCVIIVFIVGLAGKVDPLKRLRVNMMIKLIHIPAYILIFLIGFLCLFTIFTIGVSLVLMILDCVTVFSSGLIGLSGVIRSRKANLISKKTANIHGILQFVFCADVISAIILCKSVKSARQKGTDDDIVNTEE